MARNEYPVTKEETLGNLVKVQQIIDVIVLAELQQGRRYGNELEQIIIQRLGGFSTRTVGVNNGYLSTRLTKLAEAGHVYRAWEGDNRYNRYYTITDQGLLYFEQLIRELPERIELVLSIYTGFQKYLTQFDHLR